MLRLSVLVLKSLLAELLLKLYALEQQSIANFIVVIVKIIIYHFTVLINFRRKRTVFLYHIVLLLLLQQESLLQELIAVLVEPFIHIGLVAHLLILGLRLSRNFGTHFVVLHLKFLF